MVTRYPIRLKLLNTHAHAHTENPVKAVTLFSYLVVEFESFVFDSKKKLYLVTLR